MIFVSNALVEVRISNQESHTNLTDCQNSVLMLHCLPSDSAAIMFHSLPTESQLTPRLTACQGHEAKGSFCPMLNDALRIQHGTLVSNCMQKQGRADWCQSPNVLDINTSSLKGIHPHIHSVKQIRKGKFALSQRKLTLSKAISRILISNFSNSCFSIFFEYRSYFRYCTS